MTFGVMAIGRSDDPELVEYLSIRSDLQMTAELLADFRCEASSHYGAGVPLARGKSKCDKTFQVGDVTFECQITASRVALYCRKFDKCGGWWGDPVSMVVLNAGSKVLAAAARRGKALVGHLRYLWIRSVMFHPKLGVRGSGFVRLTYTDGTDDSSSCFIYIVLPKSHDSAVLAWDIV